MKQSGLTYRPDLVWSVCVKTVNIQAAKTHLSRLVEEVAEGEEIILAKAGKPMVRMVPYAAARKARVSGLFAGKAWEAENCWSANDNVLDDSVAGPLFHGAVEEPPAPAKGGTQS